ncbi:MAG: DUF520 family protein [SAR202 cluster bacterium]|nr:DUF520 family protein [SAR202 cluster bacterium]
MKQRFDLAGIKCDIERVDNTLTMIADDTMKLTQIEGLLRGYLARRKVGGGAIRQTVSINQGIDADLGRKIIKAVKGAKIKVQFSIQGSELRMSGKKRDDLQKIIAFIKEMNIEQRLQYVNFRD